MLHEYHATHVLWVFWDAEFDGHLRKGQSQVKLGQNVWNFRFQNFLTETCLSCPGLSQDSKNVIYFDVRQLEHCISKSDVITSTCIFTIAQPKINIFVWNLVYVLLVCRFTTYIPFFDKFKVLDFIGIYFLKSKFWVCGVKIDKFQKSDSHFCRAYNCTSFGVLFQTCTF